MSSRCRTVFLMFLVVTAAATAARAANAKDATKQATNNRVRDGAVVKKLVTPHLAEGMRLGEPINRRPRAARQVGYQSTLVILPVFPITAAPNQPVIQPGDTRGIINALCDVWLYIVGCSFAPNAAILSCDSNGDGIDDVVIHLTDVQNINGNLIRVTIPALSPSLPGTAFPLACCGGIAQLTLIQRIGAGDDNVFGDYTAKTVCDIDLGMRAPVVISTSPSTFNCAVDQNLQVPGACFILADGTINVTSVFAVEVGNPANVIHAKRFVIFNPYIIDALFSFGAASAGKEFLIFVSGPNGTSRNLTSLPTGAAADCPLGNEQGVKVTVTCAKSPSPVDTPVDPPPPAMVTGCQLQRTDAGGFVLVVTGFRFKPNLQVTISGVSPRKIKLKSPTLDGVTYNKLVLKGLPCSRLPGDIAVANPGEGAGPLFRCNEVCTSQ